MPSVETARLNLRLFQPEDLDDLATLLADAEVMRYVGNGLPASRTESEKALYSIIRHWQEHGFGRWAVINKETQRFIGFGGLRSLLGTPEIVYHLARTSWGSGLATELGQASLRFGFAEHPFDRIVAIAKPENKASVRVMEKLGMQFEKHARYYNLDVVQYQIARDDFRCDGGMYQVSF